MAKQEIPFAINTSTAAGHDGKTWGTITVNVMLAAFAFNLPVPALRAMAEELPAQLLALANECERCDSPIQIATTLPKNGTP